MRFKTIHLKAQKALQAWSDMSKAFQWVTASGKIVTGVVEQVQQTWWLPDYVCSMVPERLADAISEVLNSKNFLHFVRTISYLPDECLESLTETHETDYGIFV